MNTFANLAAGIWGLYRAEDWSRATLQRYQTRRLRALVRRAGRHSPFYRARLAAAGIDEHSVRSLDDLERIPVTLRSELPDAKPEGLLAGQYDRGDLVTRRTSGSTGHPMSIMRTRAEERLLHAFRLQVMLRYGMHWRDTRASLRNFNGAERAWWVRMGLLRQFTFSVYDGPDALHARLLRLRPQVVEGYTTTLAQVAGRMSEADRSSFRPRFVLAGGEPVPGYKRNSIESGFGARVYDVYGSEECNLIAAECSKTGLLHLCEASVLVEVLREGRRVREGETGIVVVTPLHSYAMPFLRLSLNDTARAGPTPCPCGAPFGTIMNVSGRRVVQFRFPDGRVIHAYSLMDRLVAECPWLRQYQLVQETRDRIRLKVVPEEGAGDVQELLAAWLRGALELCGSGVSIVVERFQDLPLGSGGKFQPAVSLVPEQDPI
jgi:phenylacetate-CoA ligase